MGADEDNARSVVDAIGRDLDRQSMEASLQHLADAMNHTLMLQHNAIEALTRRVERLEADRASDA